jgi:PD-(D/E)XK nuclease superfamily
MKYSYTQIAQYLRCPRSYRHRYLDGWREKETRAAMIFGRCFEKALESYFCGDDCAAALHREWGAFRDTPFEYKKGENWDRLVHQGVHLLERFAQDNRIRIPQPQENLQLKMVRELPNANQFVAYIDAIGELDGTHCLMDWKTTTSRYPEVPAGLLTLDPQLICYSWMTGISDVALVVFVPTDIDLGTTTLRIWPTCWNHNRSDRGRPVPCPQRDPIPPERLRELLPYWSLSRRSKADRFNSYSDGRRERPCLA